MDRLGGTTSWSDFARTAPELAEVVRARLESAEHHVLATLRADGSPRVNGTNVLWDGDDLMIGCMPGTRRAADLRRDPRCALHTAPDLPTMPEGDARLECVAVELAAADAAAVFARMERADAGQDDTPEGEPPEGDLFALRLRSVSTVRVVDEHLELQVWTPASGVQPVRRG